jgi:ribonuclease HI
MDKDKIIIYTDGSCLGNPGRGGFAAVLMWGGKRKEISGGFRKTTNNRMEILAVIEALKNIKSGKKFKIILHSDSKYVVNAFNNGWLTKWESKGWMRTRKDKVLNVDLWKELFPLSKQFDIEFQWVEAHAGIPENERCDFLCKQAASGADLAIDKVYEEDEGNNIYSDND